LKVLVTGVNGQLGYDVMQELIRRGHIAVGSDVAGTNSLCGDTATDTAPAYYPLDITDPDAIARVMDAVHPDALVHCAAWTAVDAAEEPENLSKVTAINVDGTRHLAKQCRLRGCRMMYISTDYVFDGQGTEPWTPDCTDYQPLNVYGQTKLQGEQAVTSLLSDYYIVRIAWVFGTHGNNFVKTMLRVGQNHDRLTVVRDQIGMPTYTHDLARLLVDMLETEKYGIYHATNSATDSYISWYDFACEIFRQAAELGHHEYSTDRLTITPVTTAEYGISRAARPTNSRLDLSKLREQGFTPLPDWKDALHRYLQEIL